MIKPGEIQQKQDELEFVINKLKKIIFFHGYYVELQSMNSYQKL